MSAALLIALLCAAAPPASEAEALAAKGDAEALFLAFGAVRPDDYEPAQRRRVAEALLKGARAAAKDPVVGLPLAERSVLLVETTEGLVTLAGFELGLGERTGAAKHLDRAIEREPKHVDALLARGELAMKEEEFDVAASCFERAAAAGVRGAKARHGKARAALEARRKSVALLEREEHQVRERVERASLNATRDWIRGLQADEHRPASDGLRQQKTDRFAFSYSSAEFNAGELLSFENKVERLLDRAYDFVSGELGHRIKGRTQVELMTRAEYATAHGGTALMAADGFWDGNRIVINGGAELNEQFAEILVHELAHAFVTDIAGHGRVPRWLNEGLAENLRRRATGGSGNLSPAERTALVALRKEGLPGPAAIDNLLQSMGPGVRNGYLLASLAVQEMIDQRGFREVVQLLKELRRRSNPVEVIERRFMPLERLWKRMEEALE